ncbi:MAG TPA: glycosyltransferase [Candidatus Dormibacteraeota bacterium]|nr:glycosyltransferase [Candidatus Dormibacteraeota bacterium]
MNLCVVTSSYPANPNDVAAPAAADFCRAIQRRGHRVFVVAPERPGLEVDTGEVPVFWIPRGTSKPLVGTNPLSPVELWRTLRLMVDGERLLMRTMRKQSIDMCLALWAVPAGYLAWRVHSRAGVPYAVWTLGSDINSVARYPVLRSLIRRILRGARWRFADGIELAARTKAIGGMDCEFLPTTRSLPATAERVELPGKVRFLYIGRLERVKGIDVLITAMARLRDVSGAHLYVIGGGSLEAEVAGQIASTGLQEMVTMVPRGPATQLVAYMRACDCLVIPSRKESIPVVFSEALQAGIPLLMTDTGDLGTLAREHHLMHPVPAGDPAALAEAMRTFAVDPAAHRQRFEAARAELLKIFDVEAIADHFLSAVGIM